MKSFTLEDARSNGSRTRCSLLLNDAIGMDHMVRIETRCTPAGTCAIQLVLFLQPGEDPLRITRTLVREYVHNTEDFSVQVARKRENDIPHRTVLAWRTWLTRYTWKPSFPGICFKVSMGL